LNLCDFDGTSVIQSNLGGVVWRHHAVSDPLGAVMSV
jgi:hypothetical protein